MYCISRLCSYVLFVVALVLGIATAVLFGYGYIAFDSALIFGVVALLLLFCTFFFTKYLTHGKENAHLKAICKCANGYVKPLTVSSVIALVASIIFYNLSSIALLNAIIIGFVATFLFFALFIFATLILCIINNICCKYDCCDNACQICDNACQICDNTCQLCNKI